MVLIPWYVALWFRYILLLKLRGSKRIQVPKYGLPRLRLLPLSLEIPVLLSLWIGYSPLIKLPTNCNYA